MNTHDRSLAGIQHDIEQQLFSARSAIELLAERFDTTRDRLILSVYYEDLRQLEKSIADLVRKTVSANDPPLTNVLIAG